MARVDSRTTLARLLTAAVGLRYGMVWYGMAWYDIYILYVYYIPKYRVSWGSPPPQAF